MGALRRNLPLIRIGSESSVPFGSWGMWEWSDVLHTTLLTPEVVSAFRQLGDVGARSSEDWFAVNAESSVPFGSWGMWEILHFIFHFLNCTSRQCLSAGVIFFGGFMLLFFARGRPNGRLIGRLLVVPLFPRFP